MNIPTFSPKGIRPWMIKYRFAARVFCLVMLPIAPFVFAAAILWANRGDFSEMKMLVKAAFLPWKSIPAPSAPPNPKHWRSPWPALTNIGRSRMARTLPST